MSSVRKGILSGGEIKSDMNVVPLIDVMLVLLIVFMIASPQVTSSIDISLPQIDSQQQTTEQNEASTVVISLDQSDGLFLTNTAIGIMDEAHNPKSLVLALTTLKAKQPNAKVFLRADKQTPYSRVVFGLELVKSAGFGDVNLVTESRT